MKLPAMTKSLTKLDVCTFHYYFKSLTAVSTSSSQNQVELGEWATGHFMHCIYMNSARHDYMSMCLCKKDVTPLLTHWSYVFLVLTHRCGIVVLPAGWRRRWSQKEILARWKSYSRWSRLHSTPSMCRHTWWRQPAREGWAPLSTSPPSPMVCAVKSLL